MKRIVNLRPILMAALSLVLGIVCSYLNLMQKQSFLQAFALAFAVCLLLYLVWGFRFSTIIKKAVFCVAFVVAFTSGAYLFDRQISSYEKADLDRIYCLVEGTVCDSWETEQGVCLSLENVAFSGKVKGKSKFGLYVYVNGVDFDLIEVGERVSFSATLRDRGVFYEDTLSTKYISQKIKYTAFVEGEDISLLGDQSNLFQKFNKFIRSSLKQGLDENEFSIAYALLTGHDEFMDLDILTQFRSAGIAHVFAVSGLHIGFLATVLTFILRKLRVNKWLAFSLTLFALIFYSGVCGFSSSSVRAVIMCGVGIFAINTGRKYDGLSAVGLAALIVLIISPIELFTVGFQLSFGVVLGLLIITPPLSKAMKFLPKRVASSLSAVIAAQVVGIPICLCYFGKFSLVAIPFNLVFIPLTGIVYVLIFTCTLIGGIFSVCRLALYLPDLVLKGVVWFIKVFDYSAFMVGGPSYGWWILLFFLAVLFLCGTFNLKRLISLSMAVILLGLGVCSVIYDGITSYKYVDLYVAGGKNFSVYMVDSDGEATLVVSHFTRYTSTTRIERILQRMGTQGIDNLVLAKGYDMTDAHTCLTKISRVAKIKNLYYSGRRWAEQEIAIQKSFKQVNVKNFLDGEQLPVNFECRFALNGRVVDSKVAGKRILSFSKFGQTPEFKQFIATADYVFATDYQERVFSYYQAGEYISYMDNSFYDNAENNGNLKINLGRL